MLVLSISTMVVNSSFTLKLYVTCEPTSIKNPQANAILECVHQVLMTMARTTEKDMADTVEPSNVADFLTNAAWSIRSTYLTVLKASPGAAIFGSLEETCCLTFPS
jgi:hypothetical protein